MSLESYGTMMSTPTANVLKTIQQKEKFKVNNTLLNNSNIQYKLEMKDKKF